MNDPWIPHPGIGSLMLSFGIMVSLISRGLLTPEMAHGILDEQMSFLEELGAHHGTSPVARAQIDEGLSDLAFLRQQLQSNPLTRLSD